MIGTRRVRRNLGTPAGLLLVGLLLVGCTSQPAPVSTATPEPTTAPAFSAESSTADAKAQFDQVNQATVAADARPGGRALVDALVAAGFDKAAMQVTADTTSIGRDADSVEVSVLWGTDCLIGQVGGAGYSSQTAPVLGTGACLVGSTRSIDW